MSTSFPMLRETMLILALNPLSPLSLSTDETKKREGNKKKGISMKCKKTYRQEVQNANDLPLGGTGGGTESGPAGG